MIDIVLNRVNSPYTEKKVINENFAAIEEALAAVPTVSIVDGVPAQDSAVTEETRYAVPYANLYRALDPDSLFGEMGLWTSAQIAGRAGSDLITGRLLVEEYGDYEVVLEGFLSNATGTGGVNIAKSGVVVRSSGNITAASTLPICMSARITAFPGEYFSVIWSAGFSGSPSTNLRFYYYRVG